MKAGMAVRLGVAIAGVLMAGSVLAQGQGGMSGGGMDGGMGFGEHRPPIERAFGPGGDHGRWWNNPKIVEQLKLTDEQRKAMDETLLQHREKLIDLRASLDKAELAMEPLMGQDQPNEAGILAQIDKVAQARAELEKANARFLLAIRGKLTPEQWKQLQADRANRGKGRFDHEDGGPGREDWKQGGQGPGRQDRHQGPPPPPPPQGAGSPGPGPAPQSQVDQGAGAQQ
jgi:Spy/CpxP family protein refolding chaperone